MAYTVAAVMSSSEGPRPKLSDFILSWGRPRRQTGEEQLSIFKAIKARFQSEDVTRGDHR